jgi:hypothetical protein
MFKTLLFKLPHRLDSISRPMSPEAETIHTIRAEVGFAPGQEDSYLDDLIRTWVCT